MSSLPKQQPPAPSSSSSKQSAFRANNTPIASSRPRPIGKLSANQRQDADYTQLGDDDPSLSTDKIPPAGQVVPEEEKEEDENSSQPTSNFKPFFTLVEDTNSSDYHHPTVHYIFSDDDTEIITEASIRALETGQVSPPAQNTQQHGGSIEDTTSSSEMKNQQSSSLLDRPSLLPPPVPGAKERFILLDVEPTATHGGVGGAPSSTPETLAGTSAGTATTTISSPSPAQKMPPPEATPYGYRIVSVHSLASDWQVLDASFSPAPTFDTPQNTNTNTNTTSDQANNVGSNTLMLRIEGTAGFPRDIIPTGNNTATKEQQSLEEMMEQFDKRMSELRRVIETNGDYAPVTTAETVRPGGGGLDNDEEVTHGDNNNDVDEDDEKDCNANEASSSTPAVRQHEEGSGEEAAPSPEPEVSL